MSSDEDMVATQRASVDAASDSVRRPATAVSCNGTRRVFWNLVLRISSPSEVMSPKRRCNASEIRRPVAASRLISVAYVCGRSGPWREAAGGQDQPIDLSGRVDVRDAASLPVAEVVRRRQFVPGVFQAQVCANGRRSGSERAVVR